MLCVEHPDTRSARNPSGSLPTAPATLAATSSRTATSSGIPSPLSLAFTVDRVSVALTAVASSHGVLTGAAPRLRRRGAGRRMSVATPACGGRIAKGGRGFDESDGERLAETTPKGCELVPDCLTSGHR